MRKLFEESFTIDEMSEMWYGWNNEGILDGWENGEAYAILEENGYNIDSIKVMYGAFVTLGELIGAI